jgi:hypothetical protein
VIVAGKEELHPVAEALKKRKRKLHMFDFAFEEISGVVGIRVPSKEDEFYARLQAIRDIAKAIGEDHEVDDDEIRVDRATLNLLSHACRDPKDPDGIPLFGPPSHMLKTLRFHEVVHLLDFLEEARARDGKERDTPSDQDISNLADALFASEREFAVDLLGGMSREALMHIVWSLAQR